MRDKILATYCPTVIKQNTEYRANSKEQTNIEDHYSGKEQFSAKAKLYAEKDYLSVSADIIDVCFSTNAPAGSEWDSSSFEILACPTGSDEDIFQLFVVPEGPNNSPRIRAVRAINTPLDTKGIIAKWFRTEDGYKVDVKIPWNKIQGYSKDLKYLPVEVSFNTMAALGQVQLRMNGSPNPSTQVRGYGKLLLK